ncbi:MAG: BrnT family toxin [bacterium]
MPKISLPKPVEFEWDSNNQEKNWLKHKVDYKECEQVFRNTPQAIFEDPKHSQVESRYTLFSQTDNQRLIVVTYSNLKTKWHCQIL